MIKQQLCRKSAAGFETLAISNALRESGWMPFLEQPSPYEDASGENAYFQYPLGTGLVIGRSVKASDGAYLIRRLVIDETADLDALRLARPLSAALLSAAPDEAGNTALPTLSPAALFDASLPGEGFRLIDSLFDEGLLARFIKALLAAASDKRLSVHAVVNQPPETVSAQARLMMETFMRCLPLRDGLRLSWHTLIEDGLPSAPYSVFFSPPCPDHGCIRFDLSRGTVIWPDEPPTDEKSLTLARALLAHDLNWADRADESGAGALRSSPALHMDTPPFERGMSLAQYVQDWADALDIRRGILNEDAFKTLAQGEWPHLINSVINAADLLPRRDFIFQLNDCLSALSHGRGAELGMTGEHLCDLAAILIDSIDWDEADLNDPQAVRLLRSATEYAALLDAERCPESRLAACRAVHALLTAPAAHLSDVIDGLLELNENNPALLAQLQACARRAVTERCQRAQSGSDEFALIDESFVALAIAGYVRFSRGIPDLRALDKLRNLIERSGGAREVRRFNVRLDRMRKRMSTFRSADLARKRELRVMLLISLLLFLVIAGVVVVYFLFLKK